MGFDCLIIYLWSSKQLINDKDKSICFLFFVNSNRMNEKGSDDTIIYLQDEEDDGMLHACIIPTTTSSSSSGIQPLCYTYIVAGSVIITYTRYIISLNHSVALNQRPRPGVSCWLSSLRSFIYFIIEFRSVNFWEEHTLITSTLQYEHGMCRIRNKFDYSV